MAGFDELFGVYEYWYGIPSALRDKVGKIEMADKGTVLRAEVPDDPAASRFVVDFGVTCRYIRGLGHDSQIHVNAAYRCVCPPNNGTVGNIKSLACRQAVALHKKASAG